MDNAKNLAKATVSTGYNASATSIVVNSGHGAKLPAVPFRAAWWNATDYPDFSDDPNVEIVRVTAKSGDTLTVARAYEGPNASAKNTAGKTYVLVAGFTAGDRQDIIDEIALKATDADLDAHISATASALATKAAAADLAALDGEVDALASATASALAGKQATGNYVTALTGDVAASGPGSVAATIQNNAVSTPKIADDAVTFAKLQNLATAKLLGRATAGSGNAEEIALGEGLSFLSGALKAKTLGWYNVKDYGAVGNGSTDDTAAIAAAILACPEHQTVYFPFGSYLLAGAGTELILVNKNINLIGEHAGGTILLIASSVGNTVDCIRIAGTIPHFYQRIENLWIEGQGGATKGQHALVIDTTFGSNGDHYQSNMVIRGNRFGPTNGYSIYYNNTNKIDGWFCSLIADNLILSGIYAIRFGDSNTIFHNTFGHVGPLYLGTQRWAIEMSNQPGAARTLIFGNNCSAFGGFFLGHSGDQVTIQENQIEKGSASTNPGDPVIHLSGATARMRSCRILNNNLNGHNVCNFNVYVGAADDTEIDGNVMSSSGGPFVANIGIGASAIGTILGLNRNAGIDATVVNSGTGTLEKVYEVYGGAAAAGPQFSMGEVGLVNDTTVAIEFSDEVKASNYTSGIIIEVNGTPAAISSSARQTDKAVVHFVLSGAVINTDTVTSSYSAIDGFYENEDGVPMADFIDEAITNNVGGSSALLLDHFSDANGTLLTAHTMDVGGGWTLIEGGTEYPTIQSNVLLSTLATVAAAYTYTADAGDSDIEITVDVEFSVWGAASQHGAEIALRATDGTNMWIIGIVDGTTNNMFIATYIAGVFTVLAQATKALSTGVTYEMNVTAVGNNVSLTIDGTTINATNSFNNTVTTHGLRMLQLAAGAFSFNNFRVEAA
jgi:hypothetical protein